MTTLEPTATRAFIYTRISSDPHGRRLGVDRQEEACRAQASVLGWQVVDVYEDNDVSATKEKDPPRYVDMLRACEAGIADAIIVAKVDRLHRQLWKFAPFMKWRKKHNIKFATTEGDNTETSNGRFILNIKASMAEAEAERIAERTKAAVRQRAVRGEFHGGSVPFGQVAVKKMDHGEERIVAIKHHPEHKAWVEQAASRVLAGESLYGICKDWNAKGRLSADNKPWHPRTLRRILVNPSIVGEREHDGETYTAPWAPILDHTAYDALCGILNDPDRRMSESNNRKYMLSGLLFCGLCGHRLMSGNTSKNATQAPSYECSKNRSGPGGCGKLRIVMEPLEAYITEQVFLALEDVNADLGKDAGQTTPAEIQVLMDSINADKATLRRLSDEYDDGLIEEAEYKRRSNRITDRLNGNEARHHLMRRKSRRAAVATGDELRAVWSTKDVTWQRTMLGAVIERVDVGPHPRGVSSAPPRRRGEDETAWRERFDVARAETIDMRTTITWWA